MTLGDLVLLVRHCDLYFMVQYFCLILQHCFMDLLILKLFVQYDTSNELIVLICQYDLYFMVQ